MKPITYGEYGHAQVAFISYHNVLLAIVLSIFKNIMPKAKLLPCAVVRFNLYALLHIYKSLGYVNAFFDFVLI